MGPFLVVKVQVIANGTAGMADRFIRLSDTPLHISRCATRARRTRCRGELAALAGVDDLRLSEKA
jgi:hypothetical protein